ncbi:uncharacterized protein AKAME5_002110700 [Lates japonicus]|uniref:TRAPP14 N-terminal domain-containing protein n=1 Tax=Lates japonicus TaxID=270547 RepID=A0AAD3N8G4_LATJO|nr:uncharacterized protein AKAME5_002109400 [Lates japonicus]GLD69790.1 uncharacterized protein AKAME5_002110700 [Lates japonicus]
MESLCEYFMYFPAAPISSLSDPAEYTTLPRRNHVYLGETVQFLLVLRSRNAVGKDDSSGVLPWKDLVGSLSALASVCVAESRQQRRGEWQPDIQSSCSEDSGEEELGETAAGLADNRERRPDSSRTFRQCDPLLIHNSSADGRQDVREPVKSALVSDDQVIFCLTVSLDKLPVNTLKAKIIVTVWKQEEEKVEVREHGYLTLLQLRSPTHTFRQDLSTFKAQVNTTLNVLPPPSVQCQQMTVSGKHLTVLKVLNCSSQEEVCVRDVKILPNYNSSYLPIMPDGSVLVVDNVCHKSAEVTMASFCRMDARELLERHSLGRSQSFSHQQPSRSHHVRSGSVMEHRAITPPVGSPMGSAPYLTPDHTVISLDKIAKRECKVFVMEPVQEAQCR